MTRTKLPYLRAAHLAGPAGRARARLRLRDRLRRPGLLEAGYRVEFADFDNPSTQYLRWRLERRGLDAPVHDLDARRARRLRRRLRVRRDRARRRPVRVPGRDGAPGGAWSMVNLLEAEPDDQEHPPRAADRRPSGAMRPGGSCVRYRVLHGRSHLVAYRTDRRRRCWRGYAPAGAPDAAQRRGRALERQRAGRPCGRSPAPGARRGRGAARGSSAGQRLARARRHVQAPRPLR